MALLLCALSPFAAAQAQAPQLTGLALTASGSAVTLSPAFAAGTTSYTATVPADATSVSVTPTWTVDLITGSVRAGSSDSNQDILTSEVTIASSGGSASVSLASTGTTTVRVTIAEGSGGGSTTYVIAVSKAAAAALPTMQFSSGTDLTEEGGRPTSITVQLSAALAVATTVDLSVRAGGSATEGVDYTLSTRTLTFPAGTTSRTFTVTAVADRMREGINESFFIDLVRPPAAAGVYILGSLTDIEVVINDASVGLGHVASPAGFALVRGDLSFTASWTPVDGADLYLIEYKKSTDGSFNNLARVRGQATASLRIDKDLFGRKFVAGESWDVRMRACETGAYPYTCTSRTAAQTVTIVTGATLNLPAMWFTSSAVEVAEGGVARLTLQRQQAVAVTGSVSYEPVELNEIAGFYPADLALDLLDFDGSRGARGRVVTNAGGTTLNLSAQQRTFEDEENEEHESFVATLEPGTGYRRGSVAQAWVTIIDDDPPAAPDVRLEPRSEALFLEWTKPAGPIDRYAIRWKESAAPEADAMTPSDPSTGWVSFEYIVGVPNPHTLIDNLVAGETYDLQVRAHDGQTEDGNGWSDWSATVSATTEGGPEPVTVTISGPDWVQTGETFHVTATLSAPLPGWLQVQGHRSDSELTDRFAGGSNKRIAGGRWQIYIEAGETTGNTPIETLRHASDPKGSLGRYRLDSFSVLNKAGTVTQTVNFGPSPVWIEIVNGSTVSLSAAPDPVTEGGAVTVTATLSEALSEALTVPLVLTAGTAETGDYGALASITIPAGKTTGTARLATRQDADHDDETLTVALGALPDSVLAGGASSVAVRVQDDDRPVVSLSASSRTVPEGTSAQLQLRLSRALPESVYGDLNLLVPVTVTDAEGVLEAPVRTSVRIGTGQTSVPFSIATRTDADGDDAAFTVDLDRDSADWPAQLTAGDGEPLAFTVGDYAEAAVSLSVSPERVTAGESVMVTATLTKALTGRREIHIPVQLTALTAECPQRQPGDPLGKPCDYGHLRYVEIPAGKTTGTATLATHRDGDGFDETFTVALREPLPPHVTAGSLAATTVTIVDHAPLLIRIEGGRGREAFTATLENGDEVTFPSGAVTFFVDLSRAAAHTVMVDYTTADGTATKGEDYTTKSGTLTFAPGETRKPVRVEILDDASEDTGETVKLVLSNAVGARLPHTEATGIILNRELPLTASFERLPEGHDGAEPFWFNLRLSAPLGAGASAPAAASFDVQGGKVKRVRKLEADLWRVRIQPSSWRDVTVTLRGGLACGEAGAVCAGDGRALENSPSAVFAGPVRLRVADARAREGRDASLDFAVTLARAAENEVRVAYATEDGTATAGADYTAVSGTLVFAPGETAKTVSVPVLDDAVDEGKETMFLRLSNAQGAFLRKQHRRAKGVIVNDDHLQTMWLARFGRTVASDAVAAVTARLETPRDAGSHLTMLGQRVELSQAPGSPAFAGAAGDGSQAGATALAGVLTGFAQALGAPAAPDPGSWSGAGDPFARHGLTQGWNDPGAVSSPARRVTVRELLLGTSFRAVLSNGPGMQLTSWGQGASVSQFSTGAQGLGLTGETATGSMGFDYERGRLLAGFAMTHSVGEGAAQDEGWRYRLGSAATTVLPYARLKLTERLSAWGMAGAGTGSFSLDLDGAAARNAANHRNDGAGAALRQRYRTDLSMTLAATGMRGELVKPEEAGGFALALKADAFWVRTESDRVSAPGVGNLAAARGDSSRVRAVLDGSRSFALAGGRTLAPKVELGVRHDGGDAETGTGVELGAGLGYADPSRGLDMALRVHGLAMHAEDGYDEWGVSGQLRLAPGRSGRGLSASLTPSWGVDPGGSERLWALPDASGLAANDNASPSSRLDAEFGYGMAVFGGGFTGTPHVGMGLSDAAREYRMGWRLAPAGAGAAGFEVHLDATRREAANDPGSGSGAGKPEHGVMVRSLVRW